MYVLPGSIMLSRRDLCSCATAVGRYIGGESVTSNERAA
jgi:hypothetical protein